MNNDDKEYFRVSFRHLYSLISAPIHYLTLLNWLTKASTSRFTYPILRTLFYV